MTNSELINKVTSNRTRFIGEKQAEKILGNEYQKQAIDFLLETKTTCDIVKIGLSNTPWDGKKRVNKYEVTLKNERGEYTFDFYDSIKNTEEGKSATLDFYSVLACLDLDYSSDFDDFCANYGYEFSTEKEFLKAKNVYFAVIEQDKNLRRIFTEEQLEKLADIN